MKKLLSLLAAATLMFSMAGCGESTEKSEVQQDGENSAPLTEETTLGAIDVVSREAGSGTRGAFEEIIGFNGDDQDAMTEAAVIKDGNGVVATYVEGNESAIGYVSFVTLEENEGKIKGLVVDGVEPTSENVLSGDYSVARPFKMVYKEENITDVDRAFMDFLASIEGLEILEEKGAIVDTTNAQSFDVTAYGDLSGTMTLGGSTSTEKAVKAAAEEFVALFPNVQFSYDATASGTGVKNAISGSYSLGFASREIKESELAEGITEVTLCMDGIALIVNPENTVEEISKEQILEVYTGKITDWSELTE